MSPPPLFWVSHILVRGLLKRTKEACPWKALDTKAAAVPACVSRELSDPDPLRVMDSVRWYLLPSGHGRWMVSFLFSFLHEATKAFLTEVGFYRDFYILLRPL